MGKQEAQDRRDPADAPRPVIVEVTVLHDPDGRSFWERVVAVTGTSRQRAIVALALGLAVFAAAVGTGLGGRAVRPLAVNPRAQATGPAGVAAAYDHPLRCLSVTILAGDRTYARADFNHRLPCGRFTGWPTAIFHYVTGAWRPVLDAAEYFCPVKQLPAAVQAELDVCP